MKSLESITNWEEWLINLGKKICSKAREYRDSGEFDEFTSESDMLSRVSKSSWNG